MSAEPTGFKSLGLNEGGRSAVSALGYEDPTPIQIQAIPAILNGKDVIAAASTGTGKTAAFLLPTTSSLTKTSRGKRNPRILVLTPTRELAAQIASISFKISKACGQFTAVAYGGSPYEKQIKILKDGVDVLIATPGRLIDLLDRRAVNLSEIEVLVLDEADRMLDMGFLPDIKKIVDLTPNDRQTLLFSATIDPSVKDSFGYLFNDPVNIQVSEVGSTAENVDQYLLPVPSRSKPELLKCLLDEKGHEKVIVFVRTKQKVDSVAKMLEDAGFEVVSIHSDRTQGQRREALGKFRQGKVGIIVATDVLARGIDIPSVDYVVNYDLPDMPEDYIHRVGRTGRAGEIGFAVSFVSPNSLKVLANIEDLTNKQIPVMKLKSFDVDPSILKRKKRAASSPKAIRSAERARKHRTKKYDYTGWADLRSGSKDSKKRKKQEQGGAEQRANGRARRGSSRQDDLYTKGDNKKRSKRGSRSSDTARRSASTTKQHAVAGKRSSGTTKRTAASLKRSQGSTKRSSSSNKRRTR